MSKTIELKFTKMHGAGNDYVYIDGFRDETFKKLSPARYPDLARKISDRHFGVGSDGLILILPSVEADFFMRIFNADGSEAQMCGNGIRCVAKYVYDNGLTEKTILRIQTLAGIKEIHIYPEGKVATSIRVDMGEPMLGVAEIPVRTDLKPSDGDKGFFSDSLKVDDREFKLTAVGMGNPHCVIFVEELTDDLINRYGSLIENHPLFPEKTNVEFIEVLDSGCLKMRVWERGSAETLACGTGACASVVAAFLNGLTGREVEVNLKGGKLKIEYDKKSGHVFMTGPAEFIARGTYFYKED